MAKWKRIQVAIYRMSSAKQPVPTFPAANCGNIIYQGKCKTASQSFFKSESDRYLVLQMHKETRQPQLHEWKSSKEPPHSEAPFAVSQLTPGITAVYRVVRTMPECSAFVL